VLWQKGDYGGKEDDRKCASLLGEVPRANELPPIPEERISIPLLPETASSPNATGSTLVLPYVDDANLALATLPMTSTNTTHERPLVSVSMLTYNHEKYIRQAVESVLNQKTTFRYELVISNDKSPDKTHSIIKNIISNHPKASWVKYISNPQNLGMIENSRENLKQCTGNYIAVCEGDDAWIDPLKLETQFAVMQAHPQCNLSFHPAIVYSDTEKTQSMLGMVSHRTKILSASQIIQGGGEFCPTASLMFRREVLDDILAAFDHAPVTDYFIQIIGSLAGGAVFIHTPMSLYRINTICSWTFRQSFIESKKTFFNQYYESLIYINRLLDRKYEQELHYEISKLYKDIALHHLRKKEIHPYRLFYRENKDKHQNTLGIRLLYQIGLITQSAPLVHLLDRLFLIRPNPFVRAYRRFLEFRYHRRSKELESAHFHELTAAESGDGLWSKN
jgi:glycosyltransferase involved in cell wall biosynthesis